MNNYESAVQPTTSASESNITFQEEGNDIDGILLKDGPLARFAIAVQLVSIYLYLTITGNFVLSYFTGHDPDWKCTNNTSSVFCRQHFNESFSSSNRWFHQRCKLIRSEWSFITSHDYSFVTEFDLVCGKTWMAALVSASFYMGGFIGSLISGNVADTFGRKPVILCCIVVNICASLGSSFVTDVWQLIGLNICCGAASVSCYFTLIVYQLEFTSPTYRSLSTTISQFSLVASFFLVGGIAYFERHWRKLQRFAALPCIFGLILFSFLPESPRWLISTGRITQASVVMDKISKWNGNVSGAGRLKVISSTRNEKSSYLDLFRNRKVLKLTLSIGCQWFTIPLLFYQLALGSSNVGGNLYETYTLSTLPDILGVSTALYMQNRFGRKKTVLALSSVAGILMGSTAVVSDLSSLRYQLLLGITMLARGVMCTAFATLYTWTFELFPTVLRSQGMSVCVLFERVGIFLVPFITRILQSVDHRLPPAIMCALALVTSFIGMYLPETNKQGTREKYEDFFKETPIESPERQCVDNTANVDIEDKGACKEGIDQVTSTTVVHVQCVDNTAYEDIENQHDM